MQHYRASKSVLFKLLLLSAHHKEQLSLLQTSGGFFHRYKCSKNKSANLWI